MEQVRHGVRDNIGQFSLQLLQVFLVGLTVGSTRNVLPALAEREFHLPAGAPAVLATLLVAFGVVKAAMNFVAGVLAERRGRRAVLILGWIAALPIPFLLRFANDWSLIVLAAAFLGVNQGLCWSMALTSKLDLTRPTQRGLANGLNEFAGYFAVALAGVVTGYLAPRVGPRETLLWFPLLTIIAALLIAAIFVRDTRPWARAESDLRPPAPSSSIPHAFALAWRDRTMLALCQAGLVEKFLDALVWLYFPALLFARGMRVETIGWIVGVYGGVWGAGQLLTGPLSDRLGRKPLITLGMLLCAAATAAATLADSPASWAAVAAAAGLGMAMLYPTLGAAVSDLAHPSLRAAALGVYRFWRDMGYALGAAALGLAVRATDQITAAFWTTAVALALSALTFLALARETRPR